MQPMKIDYLHLKDKPIDPNKVKIYAFILSAVAALIALVTVKSNYDYFAQYYSGFGFWMRLIPFFAVEAAIITLPLVGGFGNHAQWRAAKFCEVVLIALSLTHTGLVSQSDQAKIRATKTKAEAQADFDRAQAAADRIAKQNQNLQDSYNRALAQWNKAAAIARRNRQQPPPAPVAPQLMTVPQVDQRLIENATLSTEEAAEGQVNHKTLMGLLYLMIGAVVGSATWIFMLADASRVRAWLLRRKAKALNRAMAQNADSDEARELTADPQAPGPRDPQGLGELGTVPRPQIAAVGLPLPSQIAQAQAPGPGTVYAQTSRRIGFTADAPIQTPGKAQALEDSPEKTAKKTVLSERKKTVLSGLPALATLRQNLRQVSKANPGLSFKVDTRGPAVFVRAMRSDKGRQRTAATIKLSEAEAHDLAAQKPSDCARNLIARFAARSLRLNA